MLSVFSDLFTTNFTFLSQLCLSAIKIISDQNHIFSLCTFSSFKPHVLVAFYNLKTSYDCIVKDTSSTMYYYQS